MPGTSLNRSAIVLKPDALIMLRSMTVIALGASDRGCDKRDALSTTGKSCRKGCSEMLLSCAWHTGVYANTQTGNSRLATFCRNAGLEKFTVDMPQHEKILKFNGYLRFGAGVS
jgi:hypothetical protein